MRVLTERNEQSPQATAQPAHKQAVQQTPPGKRRSALSKSHAEESPQSTGGSVKSRRRSLQPHPQSHLARSATRSTPLHDSPVPATSSQQPALDTAQVANLYSNCLKLASENKITSKNTWALPLIDHISDLVQPSAEDGQTNFQRASVTLDAGVVIYAHRVDSVHVDAFRVLGGLSRAGPGAQHLEGDESQQGNEDGGDEEEGQPSQGRHKRAQLKDVDPNSTLEPNFEALNAKKLDLAFAVDPLFHRTSAQFDAGGARGLLLHNLSVFSGCKIVFDSAEVPDSADTADDSACAADIEVNLAPLQKQVEQAMSWRDESSQNAEMLRISPALDELYASLGCLEAAKAAAEEASALVQEAEDQLFRRDGYDTAQDHASADCQALDDLPGDDSAIMHHGLSDNDDQDGIGGPTDFEATFEDDNDTSMNVPGSDNLLLTDRDDEERQDTSQLPDTSAPSFEGEDGSVAWAVLDSAMSHGTAALHQKDWAGASHWRFRSRSKDAAVQEGEGEAAKPTRRAADRRKASELIDFSNLPELPEGALDLARPQDIRLKTAATPAATLLPPDTHYQASRLTEFFLMPNKSFLKPRISPSGSHASPHLHDDSHTHPGDDHFQSVNPGFAHDQDDHDDDDNDHGMLSGNESGWGDVDFGEALVQAPAKVNKVAISYARASKQVDVRALKEVLWDTIQTMHIQDENDARTTSTQPQAGQELSFQHMISRVAQDNPAGNVQDISVHLCFICLLHLANEHDLSVTGVPSLDSLRIT